MGRHSHLLTNAYYGVTESRTSIDALIRPGLRKAFSVPAEGQGDEQFRLLLDALAQRKPEDRTT